MKSSNKQEQGAPKTEYKVTVTRVKMFDEKNVAFDIECNGIKIYGMSYREGVKDGKEYKLISFPSRKGTDGKYYSHAFFPINEDLKKNIITQLESLV